MIKFIVYNKQKQIEWEYLIQNVPIFTEHTDGDSINDTDGNIILICFKIDHGQLTSIECGRINVANILTPDVKKLLHHPKSILLIYDSWEMGDFYSVQNKRNVLAPLDFNTTHHPLSSALVRKRTAMSSRVMLNN